MRGRLSGRPGTRAAVLLGGAIFGVASLGVFLGRLVVGPLATWLDHDVDGPTRRFALDHTNTTVANAAQHVTTLGTITATGAVAVVAGLLWLWRTRTIRPAIVVVAAFVSAAAVTLLVKYGVHRSPMSGPTPRFSAGTFPSGHTLFAMSVYGSIAVLLVRARGSRVLRAAGVVVVVAVIAAIGIARVYLLDHYASDVVGSVILGAVLVAAVAVIVGPRRIVVSEPDTPAHLSQRSATG